MARFSMISRRAVLGVTVALGLLLGAGPLAALSLSEAKSGGLVGERRDGYLGTVTGNPSAEVRALVDKINAERRRLYDEVAASNGTSRSAVEALAGQKLINKAAAGSYVMDASGGWRKK